jgi:DNA-binding transcriptional ArsR family regulator
MDKQSAERVAELFRAISDPLRVQILSHLIEGELNVSSIAESLAASHSSVSHHLRNLRQLRMVKVRREGKWMYYSLDGEHLEEIFKCALAWIQEV